MDLELNKSQKRLNEIGFSFEIDQSMRDHLCEVGYDPKYGARPLKRSIQKWVDDYITETLLDEPDKDSVFKISYDKEENKTKIELVLKQE